MLPAKWKYYFKDQSTDDWQSKSTWGEPWRNLLGVFT